MVMRTPSFALMIVLLCLPSLGRAQEGRVEFEQARAFFQAEEYKEALPYFQKAYELSNKRPSTVLALAQCERVLRMYEEAILHFEEYLSSLPEGTEAKRIRHTIALLKTQRDRTGSSPETDADAEHTVADNPKIRLPAPPPAPPPAEDDGGFWSSPVVWIVAGVIVAGGVAAVGVAAASGTADPYGGTTSTVVGPLTVW